MAEGHGFSQEESLTELAWNHVHRVLKIGTADAGLVGGQVGFQGNLVVLAPEGAVVLTFGDLDRVHGGFFHRETELAVGHLVEGAVDFLDVGACAGLVAVVGLLAVVLDTKDEHRACA